MTTPKTRRQNPAMQVQKEGQRLGRQTVLPTCQAIQSVKRPDSRLRILDRAMDILAICFPNGAAHTVPKLLKQGMRIRGQADRMFVIGKRGGGIRQGQVAP